MATYILRRLLLMVPTLIGITFLIFMIVALSPGGVGASLRMAGGQMEATNRAIMEAYLEDRYGLDASPPVQYVRWLGRISPVKFGGRDQVAPSGEYLRAPKPVPEPVLWRVYARELPPPAPAPELAVNPGDKPALATAYRRAANEYAQRRAAFIATRTRVEEALAAYAEAAGLEGATTPRGRPRPEAYRDVRLIGGEGTGPAATHAAEVLRSGQAHLEAYAAARAARDRLEGIFRARPFPEAGVAVIPGVLSLAAPDFGVSFSRQRPVLALIKTALPVTLLLNLIAFPIIYLVAVPTGIVAATHRGKFIDAFLGAFFVALWSVPIVWAGVLAIGFLANKQYLGWFPVTGLHDRNADAFAFLPSTGPGGAWERGYLLDTLWHVVLPVLCLVYGGFAILSKQTRAAMLDNFNQDYVRTAKAKGVPGRDIVLRHVFRNSLLPLITMFATIFPAMLSGSVVVEKIFTVPGMGSLILDGINLRDRELVLANVLMIATVNLLALLLADILYALADPRITYD